MDRHRIIGRGTVVTGEEGDSNFGNPAFVGLPWSIVGSGMFKFLAVANTKIREFYRRTGGSLGPLGAPVGNPVRHDGGIQQNYLLGSIRLNDVNGVPEASTLYDVEVKLSAVKCFGTEDPGGTDETYLVVSLISINPNFGGVDQLVHTMRTEIDNNVEGAKVFFKQRTIGSLRAFPGGGIKIHIAIFDHEHGDADHLRDEIHAVIQDAAKQGLN